jgi:hypothetical protein
VKGSNGAVKRADRLPLPSEACATNSLLKPDKRRSRGPKIFGGCVFQVIVQDKIIVTVWLVSTTHYADETASLGGQMRRIGFQVAMALGLASPVAAADLYTGEPIPAITEPGGFEARWEVAAAVYLFAPSLEGSVGVDGLGPVDVDASFSDLFDYLDFAFMAVAEARRERIGIFGDLLYTKLSTHATGPGGLLSASLTNQLIVGTLMGEYRVIEQGKTSVDLMAGARIWGVTADVSLGGLSGDDDEYWVDPMIGVKGRAQGASRWYLNGWAMIGGFGVSSDIDWDLFGGVGYEFNDRFSFVAGYRGIGVDYSNDGFVFDVVEHGPILGGVFKF